MTTLRNAAKIQVEQALKPDTPIIVWFVVLHALAAYAVYEYASWTNFFWMLGFYFITGMFGITLGYHRLLTHRAFKAPKWVERTLATCGVLALQRSPLEWVGHHRMHHAHVDTPKDPHNSRKGFWWSHVGWMCYVNPEITDVARLRKFARDIVADPYLMWLTKHSVQVALQVALGIALYFIGGVGLTLWAVFVRLVVVYHVTWFVNSATHKWGYKNFKTDDESTNCWWVGILAFGEGWHNNHHAHADVAPAGRKWWEFDITWQVIKAMKVVGLAYDIKLPPQRVVFETPQPSMRAVGADD